MHEIAATTGGTMEVISGRVDACELELVLTRGVRKADHAGLALLEDLLQSIIDDERVHASLDDA